MVRTTTPNIDDFVNVPVDLHGTGHDGECRNPGFPRLRPEVQRCNVGDTVVVTLDGSLHLALEPAEAHLLDDLDGAHKIEEIDALHGAAAELINDLDEVGFLVGSAPFVERPVTVSSAGLEFNGFGRIVAAIDRLVGPALSSPLVGALAAVLIVIAPLLAITAERGSNRFSGTATLAVLIGWEFVAILAHETAHALVLHRGGRRVGRAGLGLHWGALSFFVDSTDVFFLPPRTRIAQALAGPAADALLASFLAIAAAALSPGPLAVLFQQLAVLGWVSATLNLSPVLELDGQHAIADLTHTPDLHRRSMRALRRLVGEPKRQDIRLALYGLAALAVGVASIALAIFLWTIVYIPVVTGSWTEGTLGKVVAVAFIAPEAVALTALVAHKLTATTRGGESPCSDASDA